MLTPDVRFEGWSPTSWSRMLGAFSGSVPVDGRGGLVLVHDGTRVRKALHTLEGRLDPAAIGWPRPLPDIVEEQKVAWVWALRSGALDELMERLGARVQRGDDVLAQLLHGAAIVRELVEEGQITPHPRRFAQVPIPSRAVVDRTIDTLVPIGRCAMLSLYDGGELHTALVLRRAVVQPARFDVVAGPEDLRSAMGLVSGEFRRDYRFLVGAVERTYGPVSIGLHADLETFRALLSSAAPGDWAKAVGLRDVVLSPVPAVLAIPLGVDATRGAATALARVAKQVDPLGVVQPLLRTFSRTVPAIVPALLPGAPPRPGDQFQPLDLLRRWLNG